MQLLYFLFPIFLFNFLPGLETSAQTTASPSVNLDYVNNTIDDYYVELYLIADRAFYLKHGSNSRSYLFEVINHVNNVYRPFGIHILLVGLEIWSDYNRFPITNVSIQTLSNLQKWRASMSQRHDNLHLITGTLNLISSINSNIASAVYNGMCRWEYSLGISADIVNTSSVTTAMLMASMIGANLGIDFDSPTCSCPGSACIMSRAFIYQNKILPWSSCSLSRLNVNLMSGQSSYCLNNIPSLVMSSSLVAQTCGNGIIDVGEDCDPGQADTSSQCCNKLTCKFATNAVCASGRCCNKATCQFLSAGVTCRRAKEECDLPEYCTGCSETCPNDIFSQNGLSCDSGLGTCYNGRCGSHNKQCKMLYGSSSVKSNDACYTINTYYPSLLYGFCSNDFLYYTNSLYYYKAKPCLIENSLCGALHCTGGSAAWPTISLLGYNLPFQYGPYACQHAFISTNLTGLRDPGMVPNGARCGTNKVCQNSVCVPLTVAAPAPVVTTPTPPCQKQTTTIPLTTPTKPITYSTSKTISSPTTTAKIVPSIKLSLPLEILPLENMPSEIVPSSNVPAAIGHSLSAISSSTLTSVACTQDYCKNGGTCYTGEKNCNGDLICCACTSDYLLPFCETRRNNMDENKTMIIIILVLVCAFAIAAVVGIAMVCYKKKFCKNVKSCEKLHIVTDVFNSSSNAKRNKLSVYTDRDETNRVSSGVDKLG